MGEQAITPVSEAFRLAVEGSPVASLDQRISEMFGTGEAFLTAMARHKARIEAYVRLARQEGIPCGNATQEIQIAAERLDDARGTAIVAWAALCTDNGGDPLETYLASAERPWLHSYADAAFITIEEARHRLMRDHIVCCSHAH